MATLTVYPSPDYNTFISTADASLLIEQYIKYALWTALDDDAKDRYLLQAFRVINLLNGFEAPDETIPDDVTCLKDAQAQIVLHDLQFGISSGEVENQEIKVLEGGPTKIEYFASASGVQSVSPIPTTAIHCLQSFGWEGAVTLCGLSTIRKHR